MGITRLQLPTASQRHRMRFVPKGKTPLQAPAERNTKQPAQHPCHVYDTSNTATAHSVLHCWDRARARERPRKWLLTISLPFFKRARCSFRSHDRHDAVEADVPLPGRFRTPAGHPGRPFPRYRGEGRANRVGSCRLRSALRKLRGLCSLL